MIAAINSVFLGGSLLIALLIMFPSFLSVRADGRVQWSWVAVFAPLFIVDLAIIILVLRSKMPKPRNPREGMDDSEEDQLEDTDTANARAERIGKTLAITYMACFTLFQILIALRLDETITASWAIICIPWFVLEFAHLILKCVTTLAEIQYNRALSAAQARRNEADPELPQSPKSIFSFSLTTLVEFYCDLSWPIVFLPTWLLSAVYFISLAAWAIRERQLAAMAGSGTKSAEFGKTLTMRVVVLLVYLAMLYTGIELRGEMMQPTDTESAMASPSVVSADRRIEASNPTPIFPLKTVQPQYNF
ncbi:hypothetical protein BASA83_010845 [Batrachochytrium salamandrivorans]|nr:hypothetical protein BASA83_010845 [Batrachochytrium salamandrivorans]